MAHTPGPWRYTNNGFIIDQQTVVVAEVQHDIKLSLNEANSNYKLMAAAPELLSLIQDFLAYGNSRVLRDNMVKVIKKVTE